VHWAVFGAVLYESSAQCMHTRSEVLVKSLWINEPALQDWMRSHLQCVTVATEFMVRGMR
jgi:hypothetical protein